jgi:hypothetical protein
MKERPAMPVLTKTLVTALLAAAGAAASATVLGMASGTYACTFQEFSRCTEGRASVTLVDGKVQSVSFDSKFCATKARPAANCRLETTRGGADKWQENGRAVSVTFAHPRYTELVDTFGVSVEDAQIVLDFGDAQSITKCKDNAGKAAGDLPERVVITPQAEKCRVEF